MTVKHKNGCAWLFHFPAVAGWQSFLQRVVLTKPAVGIVFSFDKLTARTWRKRSMRICDLRAALLCIAQPLFIQKSAGKSLFVKN